MEFDWQSAFNILAGIAGVFGSFLLYSSWEAVKELRRELKEVQMLVAGQYITRHEHTEAQNYGLRPHRHRWAVVEDRISRSFLLVDLYEPSLSHEPIPDMFPVYREFPTLDAAIAAAVHRLDT